MVAAILDMISSLCLSTSSEIRKHRGLAKEMIVERMDEAVSIDRLLQKHYGRHVNDHGDLVA